MASAPKLPEEDQAVVLKALELLDLMLNSIDSDEKKSKQSLPKRAIDEKYTVLKKDGTVKRLGEFLEECKYDCIVTVPVSEFRVNILDTSCKEDKETMERFLMLPITKISTQSDTPDKVFVSTL